MKKWSLSVRIFASEDERVGTAGAVLSCRRGHRYFYQKQTGISAGSRDPVLVLPFGAVGSDSSSIFILWLPLLPSSLSFLLHHKFAPVVE